MNIKITVLDSATLGYDLDLSPLSEGGAVEIYENTPPEMIEARIEDSDVVVINKIKLNESNLSNAKKLKLICIAATGYDNIDIPFCRSIQIEFKKPFYVTSGSLDEQNKILVKKVCSSLNVKKQ